PHAAWNEDADGERRCRRGAAALPALPTARRVAFAAALVRRPRRGRPPLPLPLHALRAPVLSPPPDGPARRFRAMTRLSEASLYGSLLVFNSQASCCGRNTLRSPPGTITQGLLGGRPMQIPVVIERVDGNGYRARGVDPLSLSAEGATRD